MQPHPLESEVHRLNALVAALAEKNLRLEEALAACHRNAAALPAGVEGAAGSLSTLAEAGGGAAGFPVTHPGMPEGAPHSVLVQVAPGDGASRFPVLLPGAGGGADRLRFVPPGPGEGIARALSVLLPAGTTVPAELETAVLHTHTAARVRALMTEPPTLAAVESVLRARWQPGQVLLSRLRRVARILLFFAGDPGRCDYPRLQAQFGLSSSGLYKLLRYSEHRGLLRRRSFQQYCPTAAGADVLAAAQSVSKNQKP